MRQTAQVILAGAAVLGAAVALVRPAAADEPAPSAARRTPSPALTVISPLYRNVDPTAFDAARLSEPGTAGGRFHLDFRNRLGLELNGADIGGLKIPQERWQGASKPLMGITIKQRF